jgi:hypothetical protein
LAHRIRSEWSVTSVGLLSPFRVELIHLKVKKIGAVVSNCPCHRCQDWWGGGGGGQGAVVDVDKGRPPWDSPQSKLARGCQLLHTVGV